MSKRYVWIALPAYGASVHCLTMKSIVYDIMPMVMADSGLMTDPNVPAT